MGKTKRAGRIDKNGRTLHGRFVRLDHSMLGSPAYRSLTPNDRSLLNELVMLENGTNNGHLYLSVRDAAARMGVVDTEAAMRSFNRLATAGFIEETEPATFHVKASEKSRARCWRLTWLPGPRRTPPGTPYLDWQPEPKTKDRRRMERGLRVLKAYRRRANAGDFPVAENDTFAAKECDFRQSVFGITIQ